MITSDTLRAIYRHARERDLAELSPGIAATLTRYQIDTPLRQAHFLAQVGHESGELRQREEIASGDAYDTRVDLGNTPERDGDGRIWKGRGLIQLTGAANYRRYANFKQRPDILDRPEIIATDPDLCCDVAGWYWMRHDLNRRADADDLRAVTRRINGGYNGMVDRKRLLARAKSVLLEARSTRALQRALNRAGAAPPLVEDGVLGPITRAALMTFQRAHGLVVDGVAGPLTWARLGQANAAQS